MAFSFNPSPVTGALGMLADVNLRNEMLRQQQEQIRQAEKERARAHEAGVMGTLGGIAGLVGALAIPGLGPAFIGPMAGAGSALAAGAAGGGPPSPVGLMQMGLGFSGAMQNQQDMAAQREMLSNLIPPVAQVAPVSPDPMGVMAPGGNRQMGIAGLASSALGSPHPMQSFAQGAQIYSALNPLPHPEVLKEGSLYGTVNPQTGEFSPQFKNPKQPTGAMSYHTIYDPTVKDNVVAQFDHNGNFVKNVGLAPATANDNLLTYKEVLDEKLNTNVINAYDRQGNFVKTIALAPLKADAADSLGKQVVEITRRYAAGTEPNDQEKAILQLYALRNPFQQELAGAGVGKNPLLGNVPTPPPDIKTPVELSFWQKLFGGGQSAPVTQAATAAPGIAQPKSQAEYDALPPGSKFIDGDGVTKTKP